MLADLLLWVEGTAPARLLSTSPVAYPLVSALHILGIALVVGSILPVDLRRLRVLGPRFDPALPSLVRNALVGFAIAASAGLLLVSVRLSAYAANPAFQVKMAVLGANALLLRAASGRRDLAGMVGRPAGVAAAAASLSLWVAAMLAGRWIAFV